MITDYISTTTLQRNPKAAFKNTQKPIQIVMNNNEPIGVTIAWEEAKSILAKQKNEYDIYVAQKIESGRKSGRSSETKVKATFDKWKKYVQENK